MWKSIHRWRQRLPWQPRCTLFVWIIITSFLSSGLTSDICKSTNSKEELKSSLHRQSIPRGGASAGTYLKDENSPTVAECIYSCCQDEARCDTVFFHEKCFLIKCNTSLPGACDPEPRSDAKYNETYLINVRDVVYTPCDIATQKGCRDHEICKLNTDKHHLGTTCVCQKGYVRSVVMNICVAVFESSQTSDYPKDCEFPLDDSCPDHEVCYVPLTSKKRWGICRCAEGYVRGHDNRCVIETSTAISTTPHTESTTPVSSLPHTRLCEYGLNQCQKHEECFIKKSSKKRFGVCTCVAGYYMDPVKSECVSKTRDKEKITTQKPVVITTPKVTKLTVSAGSNKTIQLPEDKTTLNVYVVEKEAEGEHFEYDWSLISSPDGAESGVMKGKNEDTLQLSKMIAGLYCFKIKVTGKNRVGEAYVNVTVLPPARKNQAPVAIIKPTNQVVKLPNSAILDGSDSSDDDKIVKYHWEETSGPIQDQHLEEDKPMLTLQKMVPGTYLFKLTVTDSDGAENSTIANVTVIKETDYPPKANAGSDVIVNLPQDSVILYGNRSTDDKGIKSYEWIKAADDKLTADMTGSTSPFLHLSNLQQGDYTFTLKVTDTADQTSSATVHLFVKADINTAPEAVTVGKVTLIVPVDKIILNGSNSKDDKKIMQYTWAQTSGTSLTIKDPKKPVTEAVGDIQAGIYEFTLTVSDIEKLHSTAKLTVEVKQLPNKAPVANAGGDCTITLPQTLVTLDGSKSTDDKKIVSYTWEKQLHSPAAGYIINGSDHHAVLQLVNLVAGRYVFKLSVMDAEGLSSDDSAAIIVNEDPHLSDLLEITLDADIQLFTDDDRINMEKQMVRILPKSTSGDTVIDIRSLQNDKQGHLYITFYVKNEMRDYHGYQNGVHVLKILRSELHSTDFHLLNFKVLSLDTFVCQNNCSGHGYCDNKTKLCACEAFWMANIFKSFYSTEYSNCDWSVLYFVIVLFLIVVSLATIVWGLVCWCKKKRYKCMRWRSKKRHRYSLLSEVDDEKEEMKMLPKNKGKIQNSSLMISESDFTSEEETIFVNHKKPNGFIQKPPNGISKQHLKTKMKA